MRARVVFSVRTRVISVTYLQRSRRRETSPAYTMVDFSMALHSMCIFICMYVWISLCVCMYVCIECGYMYIYACMYVLVCSMYSRLKCVCMHVCTDYMHVSMSVKVRDWVLCSYIYIYVHTYTHIRIHKYGKVPHEGNWIMYVCMYACVYVCMHVCVYMYVCMCVYVCMHAYMHACMYVCM